MPTVTKDEFQRFYYDTHSFFETNIVVPPYNPISPLDYQRTPSGLTKLCLNKAPKKAARWVSGYLVTCDRYFISAPQNEEHEFEAYYCAYEGDDCRFTMVGDAAPLMFTYVMNGCSFVVGSETPTGDRLVGHANASKIEGGEPGAVRQTIDTEAKIIARFPNPDHSILSRGDYLTGGANHATTFGIRGDNGNWRFYVQQWKRTGDDYQLYAVKGWAS